MKERFELKEAELKKNYEQKEAKLLSKTIEYKESNDEKLTITLEAKPAIL